MNTCLLVTCFSNSERVANVVTVGGNSTETQRPVGAG